MPTLAAKLDELHKAQDALGAVFAQHMKDGALDMPREVTLTIPARNEEISALAKEVEELEHAEKAAKSLQDASERRKTAVNAPPFAKGEGEHQPKAKGIRRILEESAEYKAFRENHGGVATFHLDDVETKTLMTLTTINNTPTRLPGIQTSIQDETTVGDLMVQGTTDNNTITYMEETTFTNAADTRAEGVEKPEAALAFTERTESVRKIAVWIPVTTELLEDVSGIQSYIEGRLTFMVKREEEDQLLNGNGTAPNISGILDRSIQTYAKAGADSTPDAVYKAMTKVRVGGQAEPTAFVVHPNDWQDVRLLRTTDGMYIWGSPSEVGPERIFGLQIRQTSVIAENTGLVGAFRPHSQIFRRGGISITISTEHASFAIENKVAIIVEERLALAVYRPYAFSSVTSI